MVGQFSRNLDDLRHIVAHTFDLDDSTTEFPTKILYPQDFYPLVNRTQQALTEEYISVLEDFLGVKRTSFSFAETWAQCPPKEAKGKPLLEYLEKVTICKRNQFTVGNILECFLGIMLRLLSCLRSIP